MQDSSVSPKDNSVSLTDSNVSLKDSSVSLKDNTVSLKDNRVSLKDSNVSLKDSSVSLKDNSLSLKDSTSRSNDKGNGSQVRHILDFSRDCEGGSFGYEEGSYDREDGSVDAGAMELSCSEVPLYKSSLARGTGIAHPMPPKEADEIGLLSLASEGSIHASLDMMSPWLELTSPQDLGLLIPMTTR
ncbi:hypothetical protein U0070_010026 [Myodes glareolus]|uniref:Uncharacterized protein n=1 Tax=Myodes glareolus TaxID=447135 RepID=A0AAW0I3A1_MYOGA